MSTRAVARTASGMLNLFLQTRTLPAAPANRSPTPLSIFRHLGAFGLFFFAILDSSPLPTFGGTDVLVAILVSTRRNPWYEYVAVATAGSVLGAYITFRLARKAGAAYLNSKFGQKKVAASLKIFQKWGTGTLIASTAVPFPFPTSLVFAAAGASDYHLGRFLPVVGVSRGVRYTVIALVTDLYGRRFIRVFLHPTQYWQWLLLFTVIILVLIGLGILLNRRLEMVVQ